MSSSNIDFDALLVDWLYGELDSADVERFESHLKSHPEDAAEAQAMLRVRSCAKGFAEAEPPDTLTTILMHEAACQAKASNKGAGLWSAFSNFFQPIFMHPAASAMASFVLVVGVAGALYMRQGSDMIAEPIASSSATAPESVTITRQDSPLPGAPSPLLEEALVEEEAEATDEKDSDFGFAAKEEAAPVELQDNLVGLLDEKGESRLAKARLVVAKNDSPKSSDLSSVKDSRRPKGKTGKFGKKLAFDGASSTNAVSGSNRGYRDDKLGGAISDLDASDSNMPGVRKADKKKQREGKIVAEQQSWEEGKASSFRVAVKSKRCQDAGRIANDIRDRNSDYYKSSIQGSKEESDCKFYIVKETKRRAKVARKAATSKKRSARKQGNSVPTKAVAAPEADMAAPDSAKGL
ncbi:MAG: hypothetical protein JKY56_03035 [Kofleriaceae bacterium]|nr:hypothetical protein [Kofleriaceae bacterium]